MCGGRCGGGASGGQDWLRFLLTNTVEVISLSGYQRAEREAVAGLRSLRDERKRVCERERGTD